MEKRDTINQACFYPWGRIRHNKIHYDTVASSSPLDSDPSSVTTAPLRPDTTGSLSMHALAETGGEADARITSLIPTMTVTVQSIATIVDRTTTAMTSQSHEIGGIDAAPSASGGNGVLVSYRVWWFDVLGSFWMFCTLV